MNLPDGIDVQVRHYRSVKGAETPLLLRHEARGVGAAILPHGGRTDVQITVNGRKTIGRAYCSKSDNFVKRVGYQLALIRALQEMFPRRPTFETQRDAQIFEARGAGHS